MQKRFTALLGAVALSASLAAAAGAATAKPKVNGSCSNAGQTAKAGTQNLVCTKSGKKLVWKAAAATAASAATTAAPAVTAAPTKAQAWQNLVAAVETTAKEKHLYAEGYGITGVCNDSVAVVQKAVTGHAGQYPLLMKDSVLMGEIDKRLGDTNKADDASFKSLRAAIQELPTDTRMTPSTKARALASLPWAEGKEPFQSSVDARRILSE